jgi:hypothetical protein
MSDRLGDLGVELGDEKLRLLLYADDLTLLAASPADLQKLLECLQGFGDHYRMHVNVAKSAVVFGWSLVRGALPVGTSPKVVGCMMASRCPCSEFSLSGHSVSRDKRGVGLCRGPPLGRLACYVGDAESVQ